MTGETTPLNPPPASEPSSDGSVVARYDTQPLKPPSPQPVVEGTRPLGASPPAPPAPPTGELPPGAATARLDPGEVKNIVEQASRGNAPPKFTTGDEVAGIVEQASGGNAPPKFTTGDIDGLIGNLDNFTKERSAVDTICDILVKEFPHLQAAVEVSKVEIVKFPKDDTGRHVKESVYEAFNVTPLETIRRFLHIAVGDSRLNLLATRNPDNSPEQMATKIADQILETIAGMKIVYPKRDAERAELPFFTHEQKQLLFLDLVRGKITETLSDHIVKVRASANDLSR